MTAVLFATGLFLYLRLGAALDATINQTLRTRADHLVLVAKESSRLPAGAGERLGGYGGDFAQLLDASGAVVDATPQLGARPLLSIDEISRASEGTFSIERRDVPRSDDPARLLAMPVTTNVRRLVVVVGASLEARSEALESLLAQLLVGGPIALALSSLAAYGLAAAALRPVDLMRREAEAVSAAEPGRRLPIPPAEDEVRRLGETLNKMLERLEEALERERRFVSDASHELRTPLASLRAEVDLALRRKRTPEELEAALRSAAEETERLSQLAEDLLVLARAEGGQLPVRRERIGVAELLRGVAARYAERAVEAGRGLDIEAEEQLEVLVDRMRAEQALGNLLENALRHSRGRIRMAACRRDGRIELHVRDEGPGFTPGFIDHAFDPFTRGDPARSGEGVGLGLAIVNVIARAHGGSACAVNVDGGADAWLELPDELNGAQPGAETAGYRG